MVRSVNGTERQWYGASTGTRCERYRSGKLQMPWGKGKFEGNEG